MEQAEHYVIRVISLRPNEHTARRDIVRELAKIEGFTENGPRSFCGKGSYKALMEALAKRNDRIRVTRGAGSGISVRYVAKDEAEEARFETGPALNWTYPLRRRIRQQQQFNVIPAQAGTQFTGPRGLVRLFACDRARAEK